MKWEEWDCDLIVGYGHITDSGNNFSARGRNGLGTILKNAIKKMQNAKNAIKKTFATPPTFKLELATTGAPDDA